MHLTDFHKRLVRVRERLSLLCHAFAQALIEMTTKRAFPLNNRGKARWRYLEATWR
jgi:hypothetical protein